MEDLVRIDNLRPLAGGEGNTDAYGRRYLVSVDFERCAECRQNPTGNLYGVRNAANGREQNGKLVPAETGSDILRPDRLLEAPGDLKEDLVGKEVTDRVVRRLESTEVEKEDGERAIAARAKLRKIAKSTKFLTRR